MVNRILIAACIASIVPSVSRATCTFTGDQDTLKNDEIVLRRGTTTGTSQYEIWWCDQDTNAWALWATCASLTTGELSENVVINAGASADAVTIVSGAYYSSSACGALTPNHDFVNHTCSNPPYCLSPPTIAVYGGNWNDHIGTARGEFSPTIDYSVAFFGGSGDDCISDTATGAGNLLQGGSGNDFVWHAGAWNTDIYGDTPCTGSPPVCTPSGADCVLSTSDFNLLDCGGQTDKHQANGYGTVSNCETNTPCLCARGVLVEEGGE